MTSYLDRQLARRDVLKVNRRALLLTKMLMVAERMGDLGSAEQAARELLRIVPDDPWTPIELAIILEKQGRSLEAKQLYQRVSQDPSVSAATRAKASSEVERLNALEGR
jgi:Flp pilus assembly protein TadD